MFKRLRTSVISSCVRPLDSRKERRFASGEDCTLGSERNVSAEDTKSSRMAILGEGEEDGRWVGEAAKGRVESSSVRGYHV